MNWTVNDIDSKELIWQEKCITHRNCNNFTTYLRVSSVLYKTMSPEDKMDMISDTIKTIAIDDAGPEEEDECNWEGIIYYDFITLCCF